MRKLADSPTTKDFRLLGIDTHYSWEDNYLSLSQERYIREMQIRFDLDCIPLKSVSTSFAAGFKCDKSHCPSTPEEVDEMKEIPYQNLIGSLMYAMICTWSDTAFHVGSLSKFASNPGAAHWDAARQVLKYLISTANHSLSHLPNRTNPPSYSSMFHIYSGPCWR
jgi:hypothetical protein